ncbi:fimbrial protein [Haemophilus influenzae]|uniref:fimbrial protein n=1 Tax=Haemophilus influenzae TaxID=727 RepID=UPI000680BB3B|nr:fimbrial protein [Haemophilus influenzae]AVJ03630.1 fimbrial subunit type 1 domain protein [Haemophilus influenzae]AVJ05372.1 fimbrial subunit type 1 domain protein [Haemophilus influenzae]KMZ36322.1 fimbrial protein [Haemophilus influenzae]MCK8798250.1 type 1 fimbrial protein [Haemophilus influenzae]MCK8888659.1 type 1 fimbrial protein [Haemophilus influenzae]
MQKTPKKLTALCHQQSTASCSGSNYSSSNYSGSNYSSSKCFRLHRLALLACIVALPAYAADGKVTFQGEILSDGTCKIETDSQNRTVTLPTVGKANLSLAGQTAAPVPFSITLKECNAVDAEKSALLFSGATAGQSYLPNATGSGKATNVGIQIVKADGTGTPIIVDGSQANSEKAPDTGKAQNGTTVIQPRFDYFARYYAKGAATAGDVEATATFQVQYK